MNANATALGPATAAAGVTATPDGSGRAALVGHLAQLFSVTAWASGLVILQPLIGVFDFRHLVLMQMAGGALIMWPIVLAVARPALRPGDALLRLGFGALTPGCGMLLSAAGAGLTDAVSLGVIWGLMPLMVPLLGRVLLGERVPGVLYLGALIGFGGLVALVGHRQGDGGGASLVGNLLVFGAVVCSSLGQILGRYLNRDARQPMVTAALQVTGAALVAAVAALVLAREAPELSPPPRAVAELAWLILVPTVGNLLAYNLALSRLPVGWVSLYVSVIPAASTLLSWLYLGEAVGLWEVAAIAVIITGVALPSVERVRRARRSAVAVAAGGAPETGRS